MESSPLQQLPKIVLQNRFSISPPLVEDRSIGFLTAFDEEVCGYAGVFVNRHGHEIVWNGFHPLGEGQSFRADLHKLGLGTYVHTMILVHVAEITGIVRGATIRARGAETGFKKILERAGVPECRRKEVSFEECLRGSLRSCEQIGFNIESFKGRLSDLLNSPSDRTLEFPLKIQ